MATKKAAKKSSSQSTKKSTTKKSSTKAPGKAPAKKSASSKSSSKKSSGTANKSSSHRRYSPAAGKDVEREMRAMHEGKLKIGRSNKKVINPRQAIAIGLSEARKEGKKVPPPPTK